MLKMLSGPDPHGRRMILLGLSRKNTEKLLEGKPIMVTPSDLDPSLDMPRIVIFAGETEADMRGDLIKAGLITDDTKQTIIGRDGGQGGGQQ